MRGYLVGVVLLATVGCTSQQVELRHASTLETRVRGVGMMDDGQSADVGMAGNTCRFDIGAAVIGADADVAQGEEDVVHDAFGESSLVVGTAGVFVVDPGGFAGTTPVIPSGEITTGRFVADGITTVRANREIAWSADGASVELPDGELVQTEGFTVDRSTGTAFAATGTSLFSVTPAGVTELGGAADLAAFDAASGALYVASAGESEVSALEVDGTPRWSLDVGGAVTALDDMGDGASVAAMVEAPEGHGRLLVLDGATGEIKMDYPTPSAAPGIVVSPNGRSMAVILRNEVHFFDVNL